MEGGEEGGDAKENRPGSAPGSTMEKEPTRYLYPAVNRGTMKGKREELLGKRGRN